MPLPCRLQEQFERRSLVLLDASPQHIEDRQIHLRRDHAPVGRLAAPGHRLPIVAPEPEGANVNAAEEVLRILVAGISSRPQPANSLLGINPPGLTVEIEPAGIRLSLDVSLLGGTQIPA